MELWNQPGFPHKGWVSEAVIDLREDEGLQFDEYEDCEACGHEHIRFVHVLRHSSYSQNIRVGCICAEKLTDDYVGPRVEERKLRNLAARRQRFFRQKWKISRKGHFWTKLDGVHVGVIPLPNGKFRVWIGVQFGKLVYDTMKAAQTRIFDVVQKQKQRPD